jgi:hypothetical protein
VTEATRVEVKPAGFCHLFLRFSHIRVNKIFL